MQKITVVGRGTVGCMAVAHYLRWTDWEIDWIYDPTIEPAAVGEGTTLALPRSLARNINFLSGDMEKINSIPKLGIWKRGWGLGQDFIHSFPAGQIGMHFNAVQFQHYMFDLLVKNRRIKCIESNADDYENMDSNYVMACTGSPNALNYNYTTREHIPVNACVVFQCPWDLPKFQYSLTFAQQHGWTFGIPLQNRCSIGYLYNSALTDEKDIVEGAKPLLDEFQLEPAATRKLNFRNYSRNINFTGKVCYNGNASFFLEPLEATSTAFADQILRWAFDLWNNTPNFTVETTNALYQRELNHIEAMICLHYLAGSVYQSDFWTLAQTKAQDKIKTSLQNDTDFRNMIHQALNWNSTYFNFDNVPEIGSWHLASYYHNIDGLNLRDKLRNILVDAV